MPSSGYSAWSVIAGEQPTTSKWNILGSNDASFNNGQGFNDQIIVDRHLKPGIIVRTAEMNPYKFSVYLNTAQSIASLTAARVLFDTRNYDSNLSIDITTNKGRFTAPAPGFYALKSTAQISAATGKTYMLQLWKNGSLLRTGERVVASVNALISLMVTEELQLSTSDYVEIFFYNGDVASNPLTTGPDVSYFSGHFLSTT